MSSKVHHGSRFVFEEHTLPCVTSSDALVPSSFLLLLVRHLLLVAMHLLLVRCHAFGLAQVCCISFWSRLLKTLLGNGVERLEREFQSSDLAVLLGARSY